MNVIDFIFQLFHIHNHPTLSILTPFCSSCTPFVDCAHLSINYGNTSGDYINFSTDCAHNSDDYANTFDDWTNIVVDLANTPNISSIDFCIPNPALLQLLFF